MNDVERIIKLYFQSLKGFHELERVPRDFGTGDLLYRSEIHTIDAIGKRKDINLTDLAAAMNISKSGVSKFTSKLLAKGLITKAKLEGNRKEVVFNLTHRGKLAYDGHRQFAGKMTASVERLITRLAPQHTTFLIEFLSELVAETQRIQNDDSVLPK